MKKIIVLVAITLSSSTYAFDVYDYGETESEATRKTMERCRDTSSVPHRCHVIQVNQGDYGPYAKWQVQVADWD